VCVTLISLLPVACICVFHVIFLVSIFRWIRRMISTADAVDDMCGVFIFHHTKRGGLLVCHQW
jgi:hypothetical protein